ncbi:hypothetical protein V1477_010387 [Vespula maculifrons]|uniref:Uncharacterized protein n=1 Tax=Vespula maculifrons TaxID=7453 RepID=A0ABD2C8D8_VESMC
MNTVAKLCETQRKKQWRPLTEKLIISIWKTLETCDLRASINKTIRGVARGWGTDIACKYRNGTQYLQAMEDKRMDQHLNRSSIEWWLLADEVERKHGRQEGAN